jgi:hypothetical protein
MFGQYIHGRDLSLRHPKKSISFLWLAEQTKLYQEATAAALFDQKRSLLACVIGCFVVASVLRYVSRVVSVDLRIPAFGRDFRTCPAGS